MLSLNKIINPNTTLETNILVRSVLKIYVLLFFIIAGLTSCSKLRKSDPIEVELLLCSRNINFYTVETKKRVDSIKYNVLLQDTSLYHGQLLAISATYHFLNNNLDSALVNINKAALWFGENKVKNVDIWKSKYNHTLGRISESANQLQQAKVNYEKSQELAHPDKNPIDYSFARIAIARINWRLGINYKDGLLDGITHLSTSDLSTERIYARKVKNFFFNTSSTEDSLVTIAQLFNQHNLPHHASLTFRSLSEYLKSKNGDNNKALTYADSAIHYHTPDPIYKHFTPILYQEKASILKSQNKNAQAKSLLLSIVEMQKANPSENTHFGTYTLLHQIEKESNNPHKAYEYLKTEKEFRIQDFNRNSTFLTKILEINESVDLLEKQITQLHYRKQLLTTGIIGISAVLIFIIILIVQSFIRKNKATRIQAERDKQELQKMLLVVQEKKEYAKRMQTAKINQIETPNVDTIPANQFEISYSESIIKFRENFPKLSENEIKYAIMFGLGWKREFIAKIQGVEVASIRKSRQRIKNKLNLGSQVDVEMYFREFISDSIAKS